VWVEFVVSRYCPKISALGVTPRTDSKPHICDILVDAVLFPLFQNTGLEYVDAYSYS
jgi:hypothetical protein